MAPTNLPVRPTTDFAKEGLFNILRNKFNFETITVLDLFAGTGNISYEFAARGARQVLSIDIHSGCFKFILKTAHELEFDNLLPMKAEVFRFLDKTAQTFDIVFADPPYEMDDIDKLTTKVFENGLLNPGGWLIVEHSQYTDFKGKTNLIDQRRYGKVNFSIFENPENDD